MHTHFRHNETDDQVPPAFDPFAYQHAPAGADVGASSSAEPGAGAAAAVEVVPWPSEVIAGAFARIASLGLEDEVDKFQREYAADLTALFDHLEVPDALAEYGIVMQGPMGPAPAWARLLQAGGMAAAMLVMRRPELLARLLVALGIAPANDVEGGASGDDDQRNAFDFVGAGAARGGGARDAA